MKYTGPLLIALLLVVAPAHAADYVLKITVPDAWVEDTGDAFEQKFEGRVSCITVEVNPITRETGEQCTEHYTRAEWVKLQVMDWMKQIVLDYRNERDLKAIIEKYHTPVQDLPLSGELN